MRIFLSFRRPILLSFNRHCVRFRSKLVVAQNTRVTIIGNGSPTLGKSAMIQTDRTHFLINCPEPTAVLTSLFGTKGAVLQNIILTRCHWENLGALTTLLEIYGMKEQESKMKPLVFGLRNKIDRLPDVKNGAKGKIAIHPFDVPFEEKGTTMRSFELQGGPGKDTAAFLVLGCKSLRPPLEGDPPDDHQLQSNTSSIFVMECLDEVNVRNFECHLPLQAALSEHPPHVVLHFTGRSLQQTPAFRRIVRERFPPTTQHIFLDGEETPFIEACFLKRLVVRHFFENRKVFPLPPWLQNSLSQANQQDAWTDLSASDWDQISGHFEEMRGWLLSQRLPVSLFKLFPAGLNRAEPPLLPEGPQLSPAPVSLPNCWSARPLLTYFYHEGRYEESLERSSDVARLLAAMLAKNFHCQLPELQKKARAVGRRIAEDIETGILPRAQQEFPKIIFIGTAGAGPSIHRNVTAIVLRVDAGHSILLDCGVGTIARIYSFLGKEQCEEILRTLKLVLITHDHLDHVEGLPSLVMEVTKLRGNSLNDRRVLIFANRLVLANLNKNMRRLCQDVDIDQHFKQFLIMDSYKFYPETIPGLEVRPVFVFHKTLALGFCLRYHKEGWHIVFSGDTRPSGRLIRAGQDCDLLIHEATHEDQDQAMAVQKKHSTMGEAISVARKMNAKRLVLTHLSQKGEKSPASSSELPDNCVLASDGMHLTLDDVAYFRGEQHKRLANFILFSWTRGLYQYFAEIPQYDKPPKLNRVPKRASGDAAEDDLMTL